MGGVLLSSAAGAAPARRDARAQPARPPQPVSLRVEPPVLSLARADGRQQLLVTGRYADGAERDLTRTARYQLVAPLAAVNAQGVATPLHSGTTRLVVTLGARRAEVPVRISGVGAPPPARLVTDVIPVLTKNGCNQGACHGAAAGKGGFRLSLRGFDPELDYEQIVKEKGGARIRPAAPETSLLLDKALARVPHGGGPRFKQDSPEYRTLLRWLQAGTPGPDAVFGLAGVVVEPREQVLERPGATQQLRVEARYADGSAEDVTHLARFSSNDDAVATVDDTTGLTKAERPGASAIMVTYGGFVQTARLIVPFQERAPVDYARLPRANFVDDLVYRRLAQLRLEPSPAATDDEFLRRVYLDVIGTLPTPEETRAFLTEAGGGAPAGSAAAQRTSSSTGVVPGPQRTDRPGQTRRSTRTGAGTGNSPSSATTRPGPTASDIARKRLIDRLLERPEFVDLRTTRLADMLRVNSLYTSQEGADTFHRWIRNRVRENVGYDAFVRELLTARGSGYHVGPANYFRIADDMEKLAETTSQTFLGVRLTCAKCHNHPFEKWQQKDYYSLAAFFARVGRKGGPEFGENQLILRRDGEAKHPKTGAVLVPRFLGGDAPTLGPEEDRRVPLANWLTGKDNLLFARVAVNRLWSELFGRGIVDAVDDFRVSNPPSNPELLDALAREYIARHFDTREILRIILNSRTYQLSSTMTATNAQDWKHFARAYPRRLPAEILADALDSVTGKPTRYGNMPLGTRALQLPDARVGSYLLQVFGRPKREIVCACERDPQPNLSQMLNLVNGSDLNDRIAAPDGRLAKLLPQHATDEPVVTELYLATLCRYPRPEELRLTAGAVRQANDRKSALEDLLWALVNSQEFLFNH